MIRALADLLDRIFRPVNALFSGVAGSKPPAQGGSVLGLGGTTGSLVEKLPVFAQIGAPTLLERLRVPKTAFSTPTGSAPIPLSTNEVRKPESLEEAVWRASA